MIAMTAGTKYVVVAVRDSADADLGLYRTPLDASGGWEYCGLVGQWVLGVTVAGSDDQHMLVALAGATKVMRSSDAGAHWVASDAGFTEAVAQSCTGNGFYPGVVYVPVYNWGSPYGAGIRRSTDFGQTWQLWSLCQGCLTQGFPAVDVPRQQGGRAFAALYTGFFQSSLYTTTNAGATWAPTGSHPVDDQYAVDVALSALSQGRRVMLGPTLLAVWENNVWQGDYETPTTAASANIGVEMPAWDGQSVYVAGVKVSNGETRGTLEVYRSLDPRQAGSWTSEGSALETDVGTPAQDWMRNRFVAAPFARVLAVAVPTRGIWIGHVDGASEVPAGSRPSGFAVRGRVGSSAQCVLSLPVASRVGLRLFGVTGRQLAALPPTDWPAGEHLVELPLPSGARPASTGCAHVPRLGRQPARRPVRSWS
ncbi:MAG: hypothetical protein U0527_06790 [Candidatus Eisenbacteria bacterium]